MKLSTVTAFLFAVFPALSLSAEIAAHRLAKSYSRDDRVCKEAAAMLAEDKACRPSDAINCTEEEMYSVLVRGSRTRVFEEITTNQYNYTQVFRSTGASLNGFAIIYVQSFQGDRHPRSVETWKVDAAELDEVLKLPPGPKPYQQWIKTKPLPPRETNAVEFAAMLKRGEKLTDEWSPVIKIYGVPYLIERECSGTWTNGGYYACNKVIKLTIKKLAKDKKTVPYCQFTRAKK